MNRRSFLSTLCLSAALLFTGCKGGGEPAPAADQCCAGKCECAECKAGNTAGCVCCAAGKDGAAKPQ